MKIGIDFDDVINEFTDSLMEFYHKKYGKKVTRDQILIWDWGLYWGISREEATKRVDEFHETNIIDNLIPLKYAINSLKKLMKSHELFIITGRPIRFKSKVDSWLQHHLNNSLNVIHAGEWHKGQAATKAEICKDLNIPILLEDAPNTAKEVAEAGVNVILFDKPWNKNIAHERITRVVNWKEALKAINILKTKIS